MPTTVTKTVKSAGGDYTSLSGWEAGEQLDLVSNDKILQAECYAMNDTTAVAINGWTTDATRYIRVYAANGEGHAGYWDTSKYRISITNTHGIDIAEDYVRVEGLQFEVSFNNSGADWSTSGVHLNQGVASTSETRVSKCLFEGVNTSNNNVYFAGILADDNNNAYGLVKAFNCVAFDFNLAGAAFASGFAGRNSELQCYNCTSYNNSRGFSAEYTTVKITVVNCLAYCDAVSSSFIDFPGSTYVQNSNYNASTDGTAPGANSLTNQASTDIDFLSTTSTNANFLAIDSTSTCVGAGTDDPLSGVYSDDVRGATRTSTWDIGADEYIAAAVAANHRIIGGGWGGRAISQRMRSA